MSERARRTVLRMRIRFLASVAVVLALCAAAVWLAYGVAEKRLTIMGPRLVYVMQLDSIPANERATAAAECVAVLEKRLSEVLPFVPIESPPKDSKRPLYTVRVRDVAVISVELPRMSAESLTRVRNALQRTGIVGFHVINADEADCRLASEGTSVPDCVPFIAPEGEARGRYMRANYSELPALKLTARDWLGVGESPRAALVMSAPEATGRSAAWARAGDFGIAFTLQGSTARLERIVARDANALLAVVVDDALYVAQRVADVLQDPGQRDTGVIQDRGTIEVEDADLMLATLRSGPLPAPIKLKELRPAPRVRREAAVR